MEKILLDVKVRDVKVSPNYLRKQRQIPAVFYGDKEKSVALQVDYQTFRKAFERAGGNQVIELNIDGKKKPVLVHDVQYNPLTDNFDHIDFVSVNMNVEVKADIPVVIVGLAPAVKHIGGILSHRREEHQINLIPAGLATSNQVDVSGLETLHSSIHLSDLQLPSGVKLTGNPDDVVVSISVVKEEVEPTTTMEAAVAESAAASGTPAVPAEGAAAPAAEEKK